jgi:uncharacterized integral membrane protein
MKKLIWVLIAIVAILAIINSRAISLSYFLSSGELVITVAIILSAILIGVIVAIMMLLKSPPPKAKDEKLEEATESSKLINNNEEEKSFPVSHSWLPPINFKEESRLKKSTERKRKN